MTNDEKIAALEREVAALKAKVSPPTQKPFVPEPYEPIDWTARMTMPPSALEEMVRAEPRGFMKGVVGDNRGPTGPGSAIPSSQASASGGGGGAGDGTGWVREIPIGPSMHQRYVDQQLDHQDKLDRAALARKLGK